MSEVGPTVLAMTPGTTELTELEQQVLAFERSWWKYAGAKETAIRQTFGHSSIRHYQILNALIDRPVALAYDPLLVRRLQRLRDARRQQRDPRRDRAQ